MHCDAGIDSHIDKSAMLKASNIMAATSMPLPIARDSCFMVEEWKLCLLSAAVVNLVSLQKLVLGGHVAHAQSSG